MCWVSARRSGIQTAILYGGEDSQVKKAAGHVSDSVYNKYNGYAHSLRTIVQTQATNPKIGNYKWLPTMVEYNPTGKSTSAAK